MLGPSVDALFQYCDKFSLDTVCQLALLSLQILEVFQDAHGTCSQNMDVQMGQKWDAHILAALPCGLRIFCTFPITT